MILINKVKKKIFCKDFDLHFHGVDNHNSTAEVFFRHVIIPRKYVDLIPKTQLMTETEWRNIGIQQSPGWIHYMFHAPGLLFNLIFFSV